MFVLLAGRIVVIVEAVGVVGSFEASCGKFGIGFVFDLGILAVVVVAKLVAEDIPVVAVVVHHHRDSIFLRSVVVVVVVVVVVADVVFVVALLVVRLPLFGLGACVGSQEWLAF